MLMKHQNKQQQQFPQQQQQQFPQQQHQQQHLVGGYQESFAVPKTQDLLFSRPPLVPKQQHNQQNNPQQVVTWGDNFLRPPPAQVPVSNNMFVKHAVPKPSDGPTWGDNFLKAAPPLPPAPVSTNATSHQLPLVEPDVLDSWAYSDLDKEIEELVIPAEEEEEEENEGVVEGGAAVEGVRDAGKLPVVGGRPHIDWTQYKQGDKFELGKFPENFR
jgi:hypothetical protein